MASRKRPEGKKLEKWCNDWDAANHAGKMKLCNDIGVRYETGRHIRSDNLDKYPKKVTTTSEIDVEWQPVEDDLPRELLQGKSSIHLDFCSFDIETTNLTADFSVLLCAAIKPYGQDTMVFRADEYNSKWATSRRDDKALTVAIAEELRKHAIVITHYGSRFDIPYLRAKMANYRLEPLPPIFGIDTFNIAKANFKVASRRLENLARYFELGQKSRVEGGLWMRAGMDGDKKALDAIVEHNIQDVVLLEKLAMISFPYLRSIRRL